MIAIEGLLLLSWDEVKSHKLDLVSPTPQVDQGPIVPHFAQHLLRVHTPRGGVQNDIQGVGLDVLEADKVGGSQLQRLLLLVGAVTDCVHLSPNCLVQELDGQMAETPKAHHTHLYNRYML